MRSSCSLFILFEARIVFSPWLLGFLSSGLSSGNALSPPRRKAGFLLTRGIRLIAQCRAESARPVYADWRSPQLLIRTISHVGRFQPLQLPFPTRSVSSFLLLEALIFDKSSNFDRLHRNCVFRSLGQQFVSPVKPVGHSCASLWSNIDYHNFTPTGRLLAAVNPRKM